MSLINDALKRATGPRRASRPTSEGMQTADIHTEAPSEGRHKLAVTVLVLSMVGGLILATVAYLSRKETKVEIGAFKRPHAIVSHTAPTVLSNPVARAAAVLNGVAKQNDEGEEMVDTLQQAPRAVTAQTVPPVEAAKPEIVTPPPTAPTPAAAKPVVVVAAPANSSEFPTLRLQAIYFRLKAPTAMINGKTLAVGDVFEGVKVTQIQRQFVYVSRGEEVRELRLR